MVNCVMALLLICIPLFLASWFAQNQQRVAFQELHDRVSRRQTSALSPSVSMLKFNWLTPIGSLFLVKKIRELYGIRGGEEEALAGKVQALEFVGYALSGFLLLPLLWVYLNP